MPIGTKNESIPTDQLSQFKVKTPKFTPKWSRDWVIPDNDLLAGDVKVELQVDSTFPVDRPKAYIDPLQDWDKGGVNDMTISGLSLKNKKVVKTDGKVPSHRFTLKNNIWDTYDKLLYHFDAKIDNTTQRTSKALKVKRWHVAAVDMSDTRPSFPAMRNSEATNFENAFNGSDDDVCKAQRFQADTTNAAQFGALMKNTYSFNYTGHGGVVCGVCNAMYETIDDVPHDDPKFLRWTYCSKDYKHDQPCSAHCVGDYPWIWGQDIADPANVPIVPKYLMFSICCGGAFEPSLFTAYINRGTRYAIGFRKATLCVWARDYAKSFYTTWAKTHKCNPDKIPDVYKSLWATWSTKLEPVFFGDNSVPSAPQDPKPGPSASAWLKHVGNVVRDIF